MVYLCWSLSSSKQRTRINEKPRELVVGYAVGRGIEGWVFAGNCEPCVDAERIGQ